MQFKQVGGAASHVGLTITKPPSESVTMNLRAIAALVKGGQTFTGELSEPANVLSELLARSKGLERRRRRHDELLAGQSRNNGATFAYS